MSDDEHIEKDELEEAVVEAALCDFALLPGWVLRAVLERRCQQESEDPPLAEP
jgi:hypothetical protein